MQDRADENKVILRDANFDIPVAFDYFRKAILLAAAYNSTVKNLKVSTKMSMSNTDHYGCTQKTAVRNIAGY